MSTKIYNGFKFKSPSLIIIHKQITDFRKTLEKLRMDATCQIVARLATRSIDDAAIGGVALTKCPWSEAHQEISTRQEEIKKKGRRDPAVDFDFSVVVLPYGKSVYGIVYTEQQSWHDVFLKDVPTQDFAYWDNSDGPDDVSEKEWEKRGVIWDNIFKDDSRPSACGFVAEFPNNRDFADPDDVIPFIPSMEERLQTRSIDLVAANWMKKKQDEEKTTDLQMEWITQAVRYTETDEGKVKVKQTKKYLTHKLKPITKDMLTQDPESRK